MLHRISRARSRGARVTHVTIVAAMAAMSTASIASAQVIRVPRDAGLPPRVWASASLAALSTESVVDGRSGSVWEFGNRSAAQYRGSLEFAVAQGITAGVVGTFARAPMRYRIFDPLVDPVGCTGCYATADISSLGALFRIGGGAGFHQVIEGSAGIVQYGNFKLRDGTPLPPGTDRDITGTIGYGAGYGFGRTFQLSLVQDFGITMHQKDALPEDAGRVTQQRTTRLSLRYGFGAKR